MDFGCCVSPTEQHNNEQGRSVIGTKTLWQSKSFHPRSSPPVNSIIIRLHRNLYLFCLSSTSTATTTWNQRKWPGNRVLSFCLSFFAVEPAIYYLVRPNKYYHPSWNLEMPLMYPLCSLIPGCYGAPPPPLPHP